MKNNDEFNYNHDKANEIRQSIDPTGKIYQNISERMKDALTLFSFARTEGAKISYGNSPYNNVSGNTVQKIVTAAEIMDGLVQQGIMKGKMVNSNQRITDDSYDGLFDVILSGLFRGLTGMDSDTVDDIIGNVEEVYE